MGGRMGVSGTWLAAPSVMETELFAACTEGDVAKAKELLKKETKETIDQVDFYGYTALHAACEAGHADLIVPLLEAGADINRATYDATFTSLHHALAKAKWDCARILVKAGANLHATNQEGKTPELLADFVNEQPMKEFLAKAATGIVGPAPGKQERAAVVQREIVVPSGWGPG